MSLTGSDSGRIRIRNTAVFLLPPATPQNLPLDPDPQQIKYVGTGYLCTFISPLYDAQQFCDKNKIVALEKKICETTLRLSLKGHLSIWPFLFFER